jgi:hypothetical protein
LAPVLRVLELQVLSHLQEAEAAERGEQPAAVFLHVRAHRRAEPLDVQPDAAPLLLGGGRDGRAGDPHHPAEGVDALRVQVGEANPELAPFAGLLLPDHLAGGDHAPRRARLEAARERLPDLGEVRGAQVHPLFGDVDGLRFERGAERSADLHQPFERNPRRARRASIIRAHVVLHEGPREAPATSELRVPRR